MTTLKVQPREKTKDVKVIREEGSMPAVLYGPKEDALSITISVKDFGKVLKGR